MSAYAVFNYAEGMLWMVLGVVLYFRLRGGDRRKNRLLVTAAVVLGLFGISDWLEAGHYPRDGRVPAYLWSLKIWCGATLVYLWYAWQGIDRRRFADARAVALVLLFLLAWFMIWWSGTLRPNP